MNPAVPSSPTVGGRPKPDLDQRTVCEDQSYQTEPELPVSADQKDQQVSRRTSGEDQPVSTEVAKPPASTERDGLQPLRQLNSKDQRTGTDQDIKLSEPLKQMSNRARTDQELQKPELSQASAMLFASDELKSDELHLTSEEQEVCSLSVEIYRDAEVSPDYNFRFTFKSHLKERLDYFERLILSEGCCPKDLIEFVTEFLRYLPGPITPQRFSGLDGPTVQQEEFRITGYVRVLKNLFYYFYKEADNQSTKNKSGLSSQSSTDLGKGDSKIHDSTKAERDELTLLFKQFVLDGYFEEVFPMLFDDLEVIGSCSDVTIEVLLWMVKKWALVDLLLQFCKIRSEDDVKAGRISSLSCSQYSELAWTDLLGKLARLPDKIANTLKGKVPDVLKPRLFFKHIGYSCLFAALAISEGIKEGVSCDLSPIGTLLNKVCLRSYPDDALYPLLAWMPQQCYQDQAVRRVCQKLFSKLLKGVGRDRVVRCIAGFDGMDSQKLVYLLGTDVFEDQHLRHLLCHHMLVSGSTAEDDKACVAIVGFLAKAEPTHAVLRSTFLALLETFANPSFVCHTPFLNQVNVCRSLLVCLVYLSDADTRVVHGSALPLLLRGVSNHLDSIDAEVRSLGMMIGEKATRIISSDDGPQLKFEYPQTKVIARINALLETMEKSDQQGKKFSAQETKADDVPRSVSDGTSLFNVAQETDASSNANLKLLEGEKDQVTECLDSFVIAEKSVGANEVTVTSARPSICEAILKDLAQQGLLDTDAYPETVKPSTHSNTENTKIGDVDEGSGKEEDDDDDGSTDSEEEDGKADELLDSDDDEFPPYDMSNDKPVRKVPLPCYPQEVLEYLVEGEVHKVEAALEVSEAVSRRDLPEQDPELCVELASVFLHLDDQFNLDNFDTNRQKSLTAATCCHPKECALFLCEQFYESNYNLKQRYDVLLTIRQSVLELSGLNDTMKATLKLEKSLHDLKSVKEMREFGKSKRNAVAKNKMRDLVGYFFYPLVEQIQRSEPYLDLVDRDRGLLCSLLHTLGVVVYSTGETSTSRKLISTFVDNTCFIRFHPDPSVRQAYLTSLNLVMRSVSKLENILTMPQLKDLVDYLSAVVEGDAREECKGAAAGLLMPVTEAFRSFLVGREGSSSLKGGFEASVVGLSGAFKFNLSK